MTPKGMFWCECHHMWKSQHLRDLCQTDERYFAMWSGLPNDLVAKKKAERRGWGDRLHGWLESHGITEERYKQVKVLFGLPPTCNCPSRQEWLNKVGRWIEQGGTQ